MNQDEIKKLKKAGEIAKSAVEYARSLIKPGMKFFEIAEKIDEKIKSFGGSQAFPVNLSINEIAAHSTPVFNDEEVAKGLLKVDIGVSVDGYIADTAFSLDLENSEENKLLIKASEEALKNALKIVKKDIELCEIGKVIQKTISSYGFSPIINLSGHELKRYDLHAGVNIPNHDNSNRNKLKEGVYAIEPFTTTGTGNVYEGKPSGIYILQGSRIVRDSFARKVLKFIEEEYKTLPFCSRYLVKEFGSRALFALNLLEKSKAVRQFPQLVEKSRGKVSQAENSIIVSDDRVEVLV